MPSGAGNAGDEGAEVLGGHAPHLDVDGGAARRARAPGRAGTAGRRAARRSGRCGAVRVRATQARAALEELAD